MRILKFIFFLLFIPLLAHSQVDATASFTASLDEILYIKVTSGGNIDFIFNRIDQLKNGIANTARFKTNFTVNATSNYDVSIVAESDLTGTYTPANTISIRNIGYIANYTAALARGGRFNVSGVAADIGPLTLLTTAPVKIVEKTGGNYQQNATFRMDWECGTPALALLNGLGNILSQNAKNDYYITNVSLVITAVP